MMLIQYTFFSLTARNLGTNCLTAFHNGFKSVAQSVEIAFILILFSHRTASIYLRF